MHVTAGSTNVSAYFQLVLTAGGDATALTAGDFDLSYTRDQTATAAKVDATGGAAGSHSDNTIVEVDATDCPGLHKVDFPDAAFAAGVDKVILTVKHTSIITASLLVELDTDTGLPPKNVATNKINVVMVDSADNITPKTGLSITVTKALDGATTFSSTTGSAPSEIANGAYVWTPSAADCNADVAIYRFAATGAADAFVTARFR